MTDNSIMLSDHDIGRVVNAIIETPSVSALFAMRSAQGTLIAGLVDRVDALAERVARLESMCTTEKRHELPKVHMEGYGDVTPNQASREASETRTDAPHSVGYVGYEAPVIPVAAVEALATELEDCHAVFSSWAEQRDRDREHNAAVLVSHRIAAKLRALVRAHQGEG